MPPASTPTPFQATALLGGRGAHLRRNYLALLQDGQVAGRGLLLSRVIGLAGGRSSGGRWRAYGDQVSDRGRIAYAVEKTAIQISDLQAG